ncbi:MAG: hypothetical protein B6I26_00655 [Desulfobacteraceae bacterium 4572_130]|nr:MAG: hypothetical protein B6I26_00655 [Desulfobacteraceae bacterium 4572_130]
MIFFPKNLFFNIIFLFILFYTTLFPAKTIASQQAFFKNIIITNTKKDLISYFDVKEAFAKEIEQAVLNGVPTTFSFFINVYKVRTAWFDKKISEFKITSTLKYNNLKKEFIIYRSWKTDKPSIVKSFGQAKKMMVQINNFKTVSLASLKKGEKYQIRVKAELDKVTLPLYLHYIFFFVSLWDFETNWHTIDFIY